MTENICYEQTELQGRFTVQALKTDAMQRLCCAKDWRRSSYFKGKMRAFVEMCKYKCKTWQKPELIQF